MISVQVARALQGVSASFVMTAGLTWIAHTYTAENRPVAMGAALVSHAFGAFAGPGPSAIIAGAFGYSAPYWLMTIGLFLTCAAVGAVEEPDELPHKSFRTLKSFKSMRKLSMPEPDLEPPPIHEQLCNSHVLGINALLFATRFIEGLVLSTGMNLAIYDTFRFSIALQGVVWLLPSAAYVVSMPLSLLPLPWAASSLGVCLMASGVSMTAFGFIAHSFPLLLPGLILALTGTSFAGTPALIVLADIVEMDMIPHGTGQAYALADACESLGLGAGGFVSGLKALPGPFWLRCQVSAGGILLLLAATVHMRSLETPALGDSFEFPDVETITIDALTDGPPEAPPSPPAGRPKNLLALGAAGYASPGIPGIDKLPSMVRKPRSKGSPTPSPTGEDLRTSSLPLLRADSEAPLGPESPTSSRLGRRTSSLPELRPDGDDPPDLHVSGEASSSAPPASTEAQDPQPPPAPKKAVRFQ